MPSIIRNTWLGPLRRRSSSRGDRDAQRRHPEVTDRFAAEIELGTHLLAKLDNLAVTDAQFYRLVVQGDVTVEEQAVRVVRSHESIHEPVVVEDIAVHKQDRPTPAQLIAQRPQGAMLPAS